MAKRRFKSSKRPRRPNFNSNLSRLNRFKRKRSLIKEQIDTNLRFIRNLSKHTLTAPEITLLGKGLGFIPTPPQPKRNSLLQAMNQLTRTMRINYFMHDKPSKPYTKFRVPSTWQPRPTPCCNLEDYFLNTKASLAKIPVRHAGRNLSCQELAAIRSLRNDTSIVIKKFDKGRGIAILDKEDYISEALRQLSSHQYKCLDSDITHVTILKVRSLVTKLFSEKIISEDIFNYLNPSNHKIRTPIFYLLPKVHKKPPEGSIFIGRPIISGCGGPTQQISEFLDYFLLPLVKNQPTYVKDTNHILNLLENLQLPESTLLVTLDVVGMYTNIPQDEAISACASVLSNADPNLYSLKIPPENLITELLTLIIKRNCFTFNGKFYLQTMGVAMGSESSPEIADITFHLLENRIKPLSKKIITWLRYRDDILMFFDGTTSELNNFVDQINTLHPTLKFTAEASFTEVSYLDILIFKGNRFANSRYLDTRTYTKPCETFQYLSRNSSHPKSCLKGFIKGETLRHLRLCNNRSDFNGKVNFFKKKLLERDYSEDFINSATSAITFEHRADLLIPKPKLRNPPLIFKFTYTPYIKTKDLKQCLLKHWHFIMEHPVLPKIFPNPPLIAYKRANNLSDSLVRASLNSEISSNFLDNLDKSLIEILFELMLE